MVVVVVWGLPYLRYWIPCAIQPPVAAAAVPAPTSQPARSVVGAVTWPAGRLLVVSTPDPAGRDRRLWAAPFARTRVLPVPWLWQSGGRAPRFCFCRPQGGGGGGVPVDFFPSVPICAGVPPPITAVRLSFSSCLPCSPPAVVVPESKRVVSRSPPPLSTGAHSYARGCSSCAHDARWPWVGEEGGGVRKLGTYCYAFVSRRLRW